jgi:hypothetical protein
MRGGAVESCAVVICACASRAVVLTGSVADALAVLWRFIVCVCWGSQLRKGTGAGRAGRMM